MKKERVNRQHNKKAREEEEEKDERKCTDSNKERVPFSPDPDKGHSLI